MAQVKKRPSFKFNKTTDASVKIYAHQALTLPRTNFHLANLEDHINIEPSRIIGIEKETTLLWERDADNALNLKPSTNLYGLTALYAHSLGERDVFTGLLRMPRSVCSDRAYSWTCQDNQKHDAFDHSYCVVVLQSDTLQQLLDSAHKATETQQIALTGNAGLCKM